MQDGCLITTIWRLDIFRFFKQNVCKTSLTLIKQNTVYTIKKVFFQVFENYMAKTNL